MTPNSFDETAPVRLSDIQTTWRRLNDPLRFVMIYGPAIQSYLIALFRTSRRDEQLADDVLQDVLTQVTEKGFPTFDSSRGKFRHYLKEIVRNAAQKRARPGKERERLADATELEYMAREAPDEAEQAWKENWRACVFQQALRALERHERETGRGNLAYTVIRLSIDHPDCDQRELAAKAGTIAGQPLTPEAFRKQLSRARRLLANLIVTEVQQTLDSASEDEVQEELADLGLLVYVADFIATR